MTNVAAPSNAIYDVVVTIASNTLSCLFVQRQTLSLLDNENVIYLAAKLVCGDYSAWGQCVGQCGQKGIKMRHTICRKISNGQPIQENKYYFFAECYIACGNTPESTTTYDGEHCDRDISSSNVVERNTVVLEWMTHLGNKT